MTALASPPVLEGWKQNDIGWWYRQVDGTYPSDSWKNINKKWYYFDDNGYMVEDSWVENYYLGSDGAMLVSTMTPDVHYVLENGEKIEESLAANQTGITTNVHEPDVDKRELESLIGPGAELSEYYKSEVLENNMGSLADNGFKEVSGENNAVEADTSNLFEETKVFENTNNNIGPVADNTASDSNNIGPTADQNNDTATQAVSSANDASDTATQVVPSVNDGNVTNVPTTVITNDNVEGDTRAEVIAKLREYGLSEAEANLYYLINEYRESLGLSKLSFSKSLTSVARAHVKDSHDYTPRLQFDGRGIQGNLHSWSNNGNWSGGAYTPDHAHAQIMWDKPSELTDYKGAGYEISVYHSIGIDPKLALDLWKSSPGHNEVIIGDNDWSFITTMGVAMDKNYSHLWFGGDEDPAGYYDIEGYEVVHP
jgi:copper amine oxidase domain protein